MAVGSDLGDHLQGYRETGLTSKVDERRLNRISSTRLSDFYMYTRIRVRHWEIFQQIRLAVRLRRLMASLSCQRGAAPVQECPELSSRRMIHSSIKPISDIALTVMGHLPLEL
nr:unnamed protein product [Spirometra erinaceieuropaei]